MFLEGNFTPPTPTSPTSVVELADNTTPTTPTSVAELADNMNVYDDDDEPEGISMLLRRDLEREILFLTGQTDLWKSLSRGSDSIA